MGPKAFSTECTIKFQNHCLSHANCDVQLMGGYGGDGEKWTLEHHGHGRVFLKGHGGEAGKYLSHYGGNLSL